MTWQEFPSATSSEDQQNPPPPPPKKKPSRLRSCLLIALIGIVLVCLGILVFFLTVGQQVLEQVSPTLTAMAATLMVDEPGEVGWASKTTPTAALTKANATPTPAAKTPPVKATAAPSAYLIWLKASASVAIYEQADDGSKQVAYLPNGASVAVQERKNVDGETWLRVSDGKKEGWLPDSVAFPKVVGAMKYVTQGANVREDPKGKILLTLMPGSPVYPTGETAVDGERQEWARVKLPDGQVGWMAVWLLEESQ